ncbi:LysR family transcriptional regulator [Phaeovulum vinaykumarii]|uniref:HTH-type transcriptional regulator CbbR n=1 Tax=Phaeovulum vinaykumarii TaxID=407234 RepID=A0A1N7M0K1_9RHOB|nr:LysR family transcriptional regulator [Phaeovulum vinaykumarii]SIS79604.1 DNA-binding transcriptional regulator, LysR family [Phaeovulum vinaykumarii]SOC09687.1 DNA-binding transcriptional LysR family regulator [Phaeovulum vinaykumarii]
MRCTLRQLQVFAAVARHASYTRAAEELHLTQPAVFTQVKQLEDALGAVLLDRIGKRLFLTEAGQAVLSTARETLEGIERLEMQLADLQGLRRGRLRLAIVSTAQYFLPRLLGDFCTENPGIEVALTVTNRQTVIARLAANEDDLCILGQPPEGLDVIANPIARNPILVLAPPGHPLAGGTAVPFAALAEAPFILREPGSGTRAAAEKFFSEKGIRPQVRMELGSNEAIKAAVAAGLGLAILSQDTITLEVDTGRLVVLDVQGFPLMRTWNVAHPRGKHLSVAATAFLAHLARGAPPRCVSQ